MYSSMVGLGGNFVYEVDGCERAVEVKKRDGGINDEMTKETQRAD